MTAVMTHLNAIPLLPLCWPTSIRPRWERLSRFLLVLVCGLAGCQTGSPEHASTLVQSVHDVPAAERTPQPPPATFDEMGLFTIMATGPGIRPHARHEFLNGAFLPETGWPGVLLDHFAPRPDRVANLWLLRTRKVCQVMGSDPWNGLKVLHFDPSGQLSEAGMERLLASINGRPVVVLVGGNLTTPDMAVGNLLWTHTWLERHHALPEDAVLITFDWPSERLYRSRYRDPNEKGRRAFVAGFHLAQILQTFPTGSRISLVGQSFGGRVVGTALHLLAGYAVSDGHSPEIYVPGTPAALRIQAVVIGAAMDRDWFCPGERLEGGLHGCERFLNLYAPWDRALSLYPILTNANGCRALGRVGMRVKDYERLGPLACRYAEFDMTDRLGREHTLLRAVADPVIARMIAPYTWAPFDHAAAKSDAHPQ